MGQASTKDTKTAHGSEDIERSLRLVETIGIQKKVLEEQNEELRSRVQELEAERHIPGLRTTFGGQENMASNGRSGIPPLNLTSGRSGVRST